MTTIELTFIPDTEAEYTLLLELLASFRQETGIEVKTTRMQWGDAWGQMIDMASRGEGADMSFVGSSWVSNLASMNLLRPIPPNLIARVGNEAAFIHSSWQSAVVENDTHPWSIPLSTYVYAIAYRRDVLARAGLDGATAFATPFEIEKTVSRLEELRPMEKAWLMPHAPFPAYNDIIHTAASWIWSSGGRMIGNYAKHVLFDSPATLAGLNAYFKLLRRQSEVGFLQPRETMQRLTQGTAAAVLTDARSILDYLEQDPPGAENIGAASVMGTPWVGGGNLVIWRYTHDDPEHLEAASRLAAFLTSKETMLEVARRIHTLPARADALDELIPPEHPLHPVTLQLASSGRTYRAIRLWRLIENRLGQHLDATARAILEDKHADLDAILTENMQALTKRLNVTLA